MWLVNTDRHAGGCGSLRAPNSPFATNERKNAGLGTWTRRAPRPAHRFRAFRVYGEIPPSSSFTRLPIFPSVDQQEPLNTHDLVNPNYIRVHHDSIILSARFRIAMAGPNRAGKRPPEPQGGGQAQKKPGRKGWRPSDKEYASRPPPNWNPRPGDIQSTALETTCTICCLANTWPQWETLYTFQRSGAIGRVPLHYAR